MKIRFDGAVKLPPHDYTALHIVIPRRVTITNADFAYGNTPVGDEKVKPTPDVIGNGDMNRFNSYEFVFTTAEDPLPIEASWDKR